MEVKESGGEEAAFQRLPLNARPVHYDVTIKPNFDDFTFEGVESIDMEVNYFRFQYLLTVTISIALIFCFPDK